MSLELSISFSTLDVRADGAEKPSLPRMPCGLRRVPSVRSPLQKDDVRG